MSKPTGRLRWMLVKLDEDEPHPVAIKLQMEVEWPSGNTEWLDTPLVDSKGHLAAPDMLMPAWKMT